MSRETRELYRGKHFYEVVKVKKGRHAGTIQLFGPFYDIYYCNTKSSDYSLSSEYKFVQVINGELVQGFTEEEILVTDRVL